MDEQERRAKPGVLVHGSSGPRVENLNVVDHLLDHTLQRKPRFPAPISACGGIIDTIGPGIGNGLPEIRRIRNGKMRQVFLDGRGQFRRSEVYGGNIVGCTVLDVFGWRVHQQQGSSNGVLHKHHGESCIRR